MNNAKSRKTDYAKSIYMAITLTTGLDFKGKINRAKEVFHMLVKLLQSYDDEFKEYSFTFEMFNKGFRETKMHFHGMVLLEPSKILEYSNFIKEYERGSKTTMSESKRVFNEKWEEYMAKHDEIEETYEAAGIRYRTVTRENLARVAKWCKPQAPPSENDITSWLLGGPEERSSSPGLERSSEGPAGKKTKKYRKKKSKLIV